ncbi:MAG: histidine kinase [Nocardioides sp.]|nr:histidine kinase [Nocardioides sp.]
MKRWSEMSQVERVDLYTRQSLFVLLWGMQVLVLGSARSRVEVPEAVGLAMVALAMAGTCHLVAREVLGPGLASSVSWRRAAPAVVATLASVAWLSTLEREVGFAGSVLVVSPLVWAFSAVRDRWVEAALAATAAGVPALLSALWWAPLYGLGVGLFFGFTVRASLWLLGVVRELDVARGTGARLAVAEERLRFSHDVHDVLGRRLSAIAVQAELAARLAERDDPRAVDQMRQVREVADDVLREARELARGYRQTDLSRELEGARSLLESAGITVELDVEGLPPERHEAAAWVVREGVTNVLRHSTAGSVAIRARADHLEVVNDGARETADAGGSGLLGLRERLAPRGAVLAGGRDGTTYRLTVRWDAG